MIFVCLFLIVICTDVVESFMRRLELKLDMLQEHVTDGLNLLRQSVASTLSGSAESNDVLPQPARSMEELEELERMLDEPDKRKKLVGHMSDIWLFVALLSYVKSTVRPSVLYFVLINKLFGNFNK